ncbi:MAG: glycine--tRNA ligase subunit beta [Gammaproteobacteria bacterium]|nr:glycine--tRNA ligase subunit beta [Gammaproteobacteria bacterium]MDH5650680.1 glycine--tRNA ligase subunit beta [Gammaproteobacteria bacterium]
MSNRDLLIEIGTEELPPKALKKLAAAFCDETITGLQTAGLNYQTIKTYASPRRLALLITALEAAQADKEVERRGPALQAAFDGEGNPTKAAEGFARSCGVTVNDLGKLETDKGSWLVYNVKEQGRPTAELIPDLVRTALDKLPIPKRMRWGDLDAQFVRPVQWVVLLFGDEVIDTDILSVQSGRETRGHRFHHPDTIYIPRPSEYEVLLESEGRVIADFDRRRDTVRARVEEVAAKSGGEAVIDEALLDEVTAMVEWPVPVLGNFEKRFLDVPQEALISTMKANQKYFHLVDKKGKLLPHFITISNIDSKDISKVREGNERVIRPRFSDAEFFWKQDRKHRLEDRIEKLKSVVFQKELGTLYDKTLCVSRLAETIADVIGADRQVAQRAAMLSRCDLMSEMVFEFTELQGIMGRYYATHDKEPGEIPQALDEFYMPRFAGDDLPASKTGQCIALAERIDTLIGIFGIGQPPTGSKDPFGLRRAALGVLRIMIESRLDLDLKQLIEQAINQRSEVKGGAAQTWAAIANKQDVAGQVYEFLMERLRAYYQDQGVAYDTFDAVLAMQPARPLDFDARIKAVEAFRKLKEAESLAAANKRISNIIKKAEVKIADSYTDALLKDKEEQALAKQLAKVSKQVEPLLAKQDYTKAMQAMAELRDTVDAFFDKVMVMADDTKLRDNRLALLNQLRNLFLGVADISVLQQ